MGHYTITRDDNSGVIACKFSGTVAYRHLLQSVVALKKKLTSDNNSILLDFSNATRIPVSHSQMLTFHQSLHALLPDNIVAKMAVVKPPEDAWHPNICGGSTIEGASTSSISSKCFTQVGHSSALDWLSYSAGTDGLGVSFSNLRS